MIGEWESRQDFDRYFKEYSNALVAIGRAVETAATSVQSQPAPTSDLYREPLVSEGTLRALLEGT